MATLVQSTNAFNSSGSHATLTITGTTAGNLLVIYAGSSTSGRSFTVSDTANGTYNIDATGTGSATIATFPNCAGGNTTITVTISGANTNIEAIFEEWSGIQTTTPFDQKAAGTVTSNTSGTSATTPTLTNANELILAMCSANSNTGGNMTISSPYSASPSSPVSTTPSMFLAAGNQQVTTTTGVNANFTWTNSVTARFVVATYILAVGPQLVGQAVL